MEEIKKTSKKVVEKESVAKKIDTQLTVDVFGLDGKVVSTMELPEALFGAKVNQVLMAQSVRVYLANQRQGNASTKTRGEVTGSTRKIYKQKGTGRARHGGLRAPIFVKGGVAHGPKPTDYSLTMPKNMKRAALISALTSKLQSGEIKIVAGFESIELKTKIVAVALKALGIKEASRAMIVMPQDIDAIYKAARNIEKLSLTAADRLNTYSVLHNKTLIIMRDAIESMKKTFTKEK